METEKGNKWSFLNVKIIHKQVYQKPTFSDIYSNFESFLLLAYNFGMVYTLVFRRFCIYSN